jgi:drug/metabolite transporter (DMT)-like permease
MVLHNVCSLALPTGPYDIEHGVVPFTAPPPAVPSSPPVARSARRPDHSGRGGAVLLAAVGMACVGGSVAVSGALTDAPLFTVQAVRYAVACGLLLVLARITGRRPVRPRGAEWGWLAGVACLGLVGFNVALVRGSEHAEPAVLGVAVAGAPIMLALAAPLLAGRRPEPAVLAAAVTVTAGAVLVQGGGRTDAAGLGWAAVVLACEVGFTLLAVPVLGRLGAWGVSVHSCWIAAALLAALGVGVEGPAAVLAVRPEHLLAAAYLAVVVTALAFLLWYTAVGRIGSDRAGLLTGVAPAAAAGVGVLLGGPAPGALALAGVALVAAGPWVGLRARRRDHPAPPTG